MAFSIQRAVSDGTMTLLPISIEYFDREEISVLFDGILNARQWAWVGTTDKTLSFTPPVANTVEVMVARSTDLSELRHQFSLGAQFTAESLDESLLQVLHIAQEATERQLGGDFFTDINMHGLQITNLGAATAPDHAVTLAQYQADASGASAAKDTAVASASTAVAASNSASASASAALISANNADVSEFNALSSASSASASASTASTKAAEAAASAAAALVSENASELAESNAKASEVAAAASAASALHPWEAEAGGIHYDLGNVRIGGVGKRITGDFSNSTIANRVMFQTSTSGGNTTLGLLPHPSNATPITTFEANLSSDPANSNVMQAQVTTTDVRFNSGARGTASFLPMTFYTGGAERMRISTTGFLQFPTGSNTMYAGPANTIISGSANDYGLVLGGASGNLILGAGSVERMRIGTAGQLGIAGPNYGTAGQVLTSNGDATAPSWGAPSGVPSGTVAHFAMNSAPSGWIKANGAAVSRTVYAELFAAIGTTYGVGNGSTTFNVPDLRGEFCGDGMTEGELITEGYLVLGRQTNSKATRTEVYLGHSGLIWETSDHQITQR